MGIRYTRTSERLQLMSDLTLEKAITIARQTETQVKDSKVICKESTSQDKINRIFKQKHKRQAARKETAHISPRQEKQLAMPKMRAPSTRGFQEVPSYKHCMPKVSQAWSLGSSV